MSIIAQYGDILVIMACIFGFFMAWKVSATAVQGAGAALKIGYFDSLTSKQVRSWHRAT